MSDHQGRAFPLDRFQQEAIDAFDAGESVLVSAPTGAGKTVIAEHAIERMLEAGQRMFYTSPIKALANQKFRDFGARYGIENVGLLTGDVTIRGSAPVVVMTTEVLRNMLYEGSGRVRDLGCVVLDEVHYLQDKQRGPVWEEVLLNLPRDVRTVGLSATVSNVGEFVDWLTAVRGPTRLVEERVRPVPLRHLFAATHKESRYIHREPLLKGRRLAVQAEKFRPERSAGKKKGGGGRRDRGRRGGGNRRPTSKWAPPRRSELVDDLIADEQGPVIWFIFSRAGCDEAVQQCRKAGLRYTNDDEADELAAILHDATSDIDDDDWYSLGLDDWQESFEAGITSHHAGLIPAVKEAVEKAFVRGLISAVFATETLALGVNLPARTVVLERLVKFNGETHELLTPLEFTQLAGRAGRRGLDDEGTVVSCWSQRVKVDDVAELAASTDFPLRSAFAPNYNMVANLIRHADQETARRFVTQSFAQFQRDKSVVTAEAGQLRLVDEIAQARADVQCDHGDVLAWIDEQEKSARADDDELGQLRPGAVIAHGAGAIVASVAHRGGGVVVRVIDSHGRTASYRGGDLPSPVSVLGHEQLPAGLSPSSPEASDWAREQLTSNWKVDHLDGVGSCDQLERHLAALREAERLERKLAKQQARSDRRQGALVAEFDAVADILHDQGFATDWFLNRKGDILTNVHGEAEAVLAEALDQGTFQNLDGPELAAVLSSLVYETRGGGATSFRWPSDRVRKTAIRLQQIAHGLRNVEKLRLDQFLTREPDPGLTEAVFGWAHGEPLDVVLDPEMTGGDFVRSMRMVVDICRQVASVADGELHEAARDAVHAIDRGVVRGARDLVAVSDEEE